MRKRFLLIIAIIVLGTTVVSCNNSNNERSAKKEVKIVNKELKANTQENKSVIKGNDKEKELISKIDELLTKKSEGSSFSGHILVSKNDSILLEKGYGMADFKGNIQSTKETKYEIGSLTKQITAAAIMQLQEKGELKVEDTIDKYLPEFSHGKEITIHELLTHTSGLSRDSADFDIRKFRPSRNKKDDEELENIKNMELKISGKLFRYSNTGYILLGYIVEKISDKTLEEYFKENIFHPLGMENTGFKDENYKLPNLAVGYGFKIGEKPKKSWYDINVGMRGAGGLCSTVEDLHKWDLGLSEEKILSKESLDKIYTAYSRNYGYGWRILKDKKVYEHFGWSAGYKSYILRNIENEISIIILSNYENTVMEDLAGTIKLYIRQSK